MNKRNIGLFSCLFLFLFAFTLPAMAAPSATVLFPNGGEILSGTVSISFEVSDSDGSNVFDANLAYSPTGNVGEFTNSIIDLNLVEVCDFPLGKIANVDGTIALTGLVAPSINPVKPIAVEVLDTNLTVIYKNAAYSWDETANSWSSWPMAVADLNTDDATQSGIDMFVYGGETYYASVHRPGGVTVDGNFFFYKWVNNVWVLDPIGNELNPFEVPLYSTPRLFEYDGVLNLLGYTQGTDAFTSWTYTTTDGWQENSYLATGIGDIVAAWTNPTFGIFIDNSGVLQAIFTDATEGADSHDSTGGHFSTSLGTWVFDTSFSGDVNAVSGENERQVAVDVTSNFSANPIALIFMAEVPAGNEWHSFVWEENGLQTSTATTCSHSWDTTTANNGLYFIDINAFNDSGEDSVDSSDAVFRILNWTDSDITCECISNCASCTLDVNAFVVVPTNQAADVQIKIVNLTSAKNVGYRILNSEDSGKQYKIHTADSSDFTAGLWALNDTLTFGTTNYNSVQKLWQTSAERYHYEFSETLVGNQTQYYKFDYFLPAFTYTSINSPDWDNQLLPDIVDFNKISADLFSISTYSDIGSFLIAPRFPALTSSIPNPNYVFQFTASADSPVTGELKAGIVSNTDSDPGTTLNLLSSYKTLTVTNLEDGYMKIASAATTGREFYFQNYAIIERGFFTKPIEIFDTDGSSLPVLLHGGTPWKYVAEGKNFIVDSEYYDPDGLIDRYEITAYVGTVTDANRIKKWIFDASDLSGRVQINETVGDLIDLTAGAANREIKLTIRLVDTNSSYYEIQSDSLLLVQFPFFPNDFRITPFILNKKVGFAPKGFIDIFTKDPESLRGVRFSIWKTVTGAPDISDYNTIFYKDVDFSCTGFNCGFNYEIDDWLFPNTSGVYALTVSALLSTELPDWNSALTSKTIYFKVYWKEFQTARIFETIERNADHTYRNDEPIPLVMQLRDTDFSNMKEDIQVWVTLSSCDASSAGTCVTEDLNYNPTSFLYDARTGYNYFFWSTIFIDDNGSLLSDGNYYRVMGTISDAKGKHETKVYPFLAAKCQTYDTDCTDIFCFFPNMLATLNHFLFGCTVATEEIVTTLVNPAQEGRLLIDADHSVSAPTQECFFCFNTDQNNVYANQLEQDLFCGSWYTFNEAPVDSFRFFLTNENSDLSKTGDDAQYISFEIPFEKIAFNDISLMVDAIATEFGTTPDTIGELIFHFGNSIFTGIANPVSEVPEVFTSTGIITNVGVDCNFSNPLSTEFIDGLLFYKLKGVKVINQQDYLTSTPEVEGVETSELLSYLNYRGIDFPIEETSVEVYASDGVKILEISVPSPLVINVPYSETSVRQENVSGETVVYESLPAKLRFIAINDLIYNGERSTIRRYVPFTITAIISPGVFDWVESIGASFNLLVSDPGNFFVQNWFLLGLGLFLIIVFAGIYRKLKGPGGQNITINNGES